MRAKPDIKPWVFTDKNKMSSFRSGTNSAGVGAFAFGVCAPTGLKKWISMPNPGLAPWACRGIALAGLIYVITTNQLRCGFDALAQACL